MVTCSWWINCQILLACLFSTSLASFSVNNGKQSSGWVLIQQQHLLEGIGVTSAAALVGNDLSNDMRPKQATIFAGTKRGSIIPLTMPSHDRRLEYQEPYNAMMIHEGVPLKDDSVIGQMVKPYPIYSMASHHGTDVDFLFCGGGDRYITVWEKQCCSSSMMPEWKIAARLGAHTGWVKSVVYDSNLNLLHSIGCNCIETWSRQQLATNNPGEPNNHGNDSCQDHSPRSIYYGWKHVKKRTIESCPTDGSTLSSDLLCLCLNPSFDKSILYSGGVDGRLHIWTSSCDTKEEAFPIHTIPAHDGRVNALVLAKESGWLFSASHDGTVQCRRATNNYMQTDSLLGKITIASHIDGELARVLSMACVRDEKGMTEVVVGTACGSLYCISATERNKDSHDSSVDMKLKENASQVFQGDPSIHSICPISMEENGTYVSFFAGHSVGLSAMTFETERL